MIEAVVQNDLDEFIAHIKSLQEKYGEDFSFFGVVGIKPDEEDNGDQSIITSTSIAGSGVDIMYGVHKLLSRKNGAELLMDGLRFHCKTSINYSSELDKFLQDSSLIITKKKIIKAIENEEIDSSVDSFLESLGMK